MSMNDMKIILGIGGGVAAYKAVTVASRLRQSGAHVTVAMTPAAQKFVGPLSFSAVTGRKVQTSIMPEPDADDIEAIYPHLYPATTADAFVLLPATADLIAAIAQGIGNDIVSLSALSLPDHCHRYFCPAMNSEMWQQQTVVDNVARLETLGWVRIGPESGALGCGVTGVGRMTEPEDILQRLLDDAGPGPLHERRVLITSGPTIEHIDPVRFISNPSSGKMGCALALAAAAAGAQVDFVSGPVDSANLPVHPAIRIHNVTSTADMLAVATAYFESADAAIFAAAVADYAVADPKSAKLPKSDRITLDLSATADIAATLGGAKGKAQICVGFALETDDGLQKAQQKLRAKNLDAIVLNDTASLAGDDGTYTYITAAETKSWGKLTKAVCGRCIIERLAIDLQSR
jgi:phosphopantothenoylcysteine decarboxylase/phosphopantothenate--cysteine ligase